MNDLGRIFVVFILLTFTAITLRSV